MIPDEHDAARRLAQRGLRQQQDGALAAAEQSLDEALQIDPDAVVEVLHETGADAAPDARDTAADVKATALDTGGAKQP